MNSRCFLTVLFCCAISYTLGAYYTENEWEVTNFRTVTRFDGLEDYYKALRSRILHANPEDREPIEPKDPKKRAHIWKTICDNVFRSPFFVGRDERWSDPDVPSIRKRVKDEYRRLYDLLLSAETVGDTSTGAQGRVSYAHGYQIIRTAYVDEDELPIDEYIFLCLAEQTETDTIKEYYVSRDYNVNAVIENTYPIVGRLIFTTNSNSQLVVEALAEETAIEAEFLRRIHLVEGYYLTMRGLTFPTKKELDPVCNLSDSEKLRTCASLFGASTFERKGLIFKPSMENVVTPCAKKRVHIHTRVFSRGVAVISRMILNPHRIFEEWMFGCQAWPASNVGEPITHYVSRGISHNSVFVFTYASDIRQYSIYGFFNNVSVVGDLKNQHKPECEAEVEKAMVDNALAEADPFGPM